MSVPEVDIAEFERVREAGAPVIDVRQPNEYEQFHLPSVQLIPLNEVPGRVDEIPQDTRVYVICKTGARSAKAVAWLNSRGYDAVNVAGGCLAWVDAGHPVEPGS